MFSPPDTILGFAARVRGSARSTREGSVLIPLHGSGVARATFLRWKFADFEFGDAQLDNLDGWFLTIALEVGTARLHLSQDKGIFWTTPTAAPVEALQASEAHGTTFRPNWARRSNCHWPQQHGAPLPFIGQGTTNTYHIYLFGDLASDTLVIHLDHRDEQDPEEHYDAEA